MKVCTDACIFGAWFAQMKLGDRILDIGSGTGLLMLILAQKQNAHIDGIEIDPNCFQQLQENIANIEWKNRLSVQQGDIRTFQSENKYDFIISNPPFHENSLSSSSASANLARHSAELKLEELINDIDRLLSDAGTFGVLLPYYRTEYFEELSKEKNFHLVEKLLVKQSPNHKYFRSILHYSRVSQSKPSHKELQIQNESRKYTNEFIELLKDYYLYLQAY
jgi:tRNA1Val (adenine37-N6)-methyltransferase